MDWDFKKKKKLLKNGSFKKVKIMVFLKFFLQKSGIFAKKGKNCNLPNLKPEPAKPALGPPEPKPKKPNVFNRWV